MSIDTMPSERETPDKWLIIIALIQGLCLFLLHQSMEMKFWPYKDLNWLFALYTFTIVAPTMLLLSLTKDNAVSVLRWVTPFSFLCALLGFYIGDQFVVTKFRIFNSGFIIGFILTISIAVFKALMYIQQFVGGDNFHYRQLFLFSWRNFLTFSLASLFSACVWGVLMLWAALFKAIEIDFFYDVFTEKWFFYPAICSAFGFGIIIFRNLSKVIDTIASLQQALMKFLLIFLALVSAFFLCALIFNDFSALWGNGGSGLILWMQALMLFFVNAVYQADSDNQPYNIYVHRVIYVCVALLPIYSVVSFYGLSLRVDQYGWTVERCWAFLIWFVLAVFSVGYAGGIIRLRDQWLKYLSRMNIVMGLVVLGLMLVVNSPLLDFRKISVSSQLARLDNGTVSTDDFDLRYFKRHLAKPGHQALEKLKNQYASTDPEFAKRIVQLNSTSPQHQFSAHELVSAMKVLNGQPPEALKKEILKNLKDNKWQLRRLSKLYLLAEDLNVDGEPEFILIKRGINYANVVVFLNEEGAWSSRLSRFPGVKPKDYPKIYEAIENGDFGLVEPKWKNLSVGGHILRLD